jgi:hypothetical protein
MIESFMHVLVLQSKFGKTVKCYGVKSKKSEEKKCCILPRFTKKSKKAIFSDLVCLEIKQMNFYYEYEPKNKEEFFWSGKKDKNF